MSNQEILERAIQKAIDGGWKCRAYSSGIPVAAIVWEILDEDVDAIGSLNDVLFNHDFAKALWDKPIKGYSNVYTTYEMNLEDVPAWKYHLMMMVAADDPIKYLGENI